MPALVFPAPGCPNGVQYLTPFSAFDIAPVKGSNYKNLLTNSHNLLSPVWVKGAGNVAVSGNYNTVKWYQDDTTLLQFNDIYVEKDAVQGYRVTSTSTTQYFGQHVSVKPSTTYTFSFWAKRGTATNLAYSVQDFTNSIDIVGSTSYYSQTNGALSRISFSFTTGSTCTEVVVNLLSNIATGVAGTVTFFGPQVEESSSVSAYDSTTSISYAAFGALNIPTSTNTFVTALAPFNDTAVTFDPVLPLAGQKSVLYNIPVWYEYEKDTLLPTVTSSSLTTSYPTITNSDVVFSLNFDQSTISTITDQGPNAYVLRTPALPTSTLQVGGPWQGSTKYLNTVSRTTSLDSNVGFDRSSLSKATLDGLLVGNKSWSFEFGLKPSKPVSASNQLYTVFGDVANLGFNIYISYPSTNTYTLTVSRTNSAGNSGTVDTLSLTGLLSNNWNHVVVSFTAASNTTGTLRAFVGGTLVSSATIDKSINDFYSGSGSNVNAIGATQFLGAELPCGLDKLSFYNNNSFSPTGFTLPTSWIGNLSGDNRIPSYLSTATTYVSTTSPLKTLYFQTQAHPPYPAGTYVRLRNSFTGYDNTFLVLYGDKNSIQISSIADIPTTGISMSNATPFVYPQSSINLYSIKYAQLEQQGMTPRQSLFFTNFKPNVREVIFNTINTFIASDTNVRSASTLESVITVKETASEVNRRKVAKLKPRSNIAGFTFDQTRSNVSKVTKFKTTALQVTDSRTVAKLKPRSNIAGFTFDQTRSNVSKVTKFKTTALQVTDSRTVAKLKPRSNIAGFTFDQTRSNVSKVTKFKTSVGENANEVNRRKVAKVKSRATLKDQTVGAKIVSPAKIISTTSRADSISSVISAGKNQPYTPLVRLILGDYAHYLLGVNYVASDARPQVTVELPSNLGKLSPIVETAYNLTSGLVVPVTGNSIISHNTVGYYETDLDILSYSKGSYSSTQTLYFNPYVLQSSEAVTYTTISIPPQIAQGQEIFQTVGTTTWTAPPGVTSISVVAVGGGGGGANVTNGGGGGGGGLAYSNNYPVTPGNTYTVIVGGGGSASNGGSSGLYDGATIIVQGDGGAGATTTTGGAGGGGSYAGTGSYSLGGNGGSFTGSGAPYGSGGGGAGGYAGPGGNGGWASGSGTGVAATNAQAGGGGGGGGGQGYSPSNLGSAQGGGGGGVNLFGLGTSGGAGAAGNAVQAFQGGGGSAGVGGQQTPIGGYCGGGGGGYTGATGGQGGVRIVWGPNRQYPAIGSVADVTVINGADGYTYDVPVYSGSVYYTTVSYKAGDIVKIVDTNTGFSTFVEVLSSTTNSITFNTVENLPNTEFGGVTIQNASLDVVPTQSLYDYYVAHLSETGYNLSPENPREKLAVGLLNLPKPYSKLQYYYIDRDIGSVNPPVFGNEKMSTFVDRRIPGDFVLPLISVLPGTVYFATQETVLFPIGSTVRIKRSSISYSEDFTVTYSTSNSVSFEMPDPWIDITGATIERSDATVYPQSLVEFVLFPTNPRENLLWFYIDAYSRAAKIKYELGADFVKFTSSMLSSPKLKVKADSSKIVSANINTPTVKLTSINYIHQLNRLSAPKLKVKSLTYNKQTATISKPTFKVKQPNTVSLPASLTKPTFKVKMPYTPSTLSMGKLRVIVDHVALPNPLAIMTKFKTRAIGQVYNFDANKLSAPKLKVKAPTDTRPAASLTKPTFKVKMPYTPSTMFVGSEKLVAKQVPFRNPLVVMSKFKTIAKGQAYNTLVIPYKSVTNKLGFIKFSADTGKATLPNLVKGVSGNQDTTARTLSLLPDGSQLIASETWRTSGNTQYPRDNYYFARIGNIHAARMPGYIIGNEQGKIEAASLTKPFTKVVGTTGIIKSGVLGKKVAPLTSGDPTKLLEETFKVSGIVRGDRVVVKSGLLDRWKVSSIRTEVFFTPKFDSLPKQISKLTDAKSSLQAGVLNKRISNLTTGDPTKLLEETFKVSGIVRGDRVVVKSGLLDRWKVSSIRTEVFFTPQLNKLTTQDKLKSDSSKLNVGVAKSTSKLTATKEQLFTGSAYSKLVVRGDVLAAKLKIVVPLQQFKVSFLNIGEVREPIIKTDRLEVFDNVGQVMNPIYRVTGTLIESTTNTVLYYQDDLDILTATYTPATSLTVLFDNPDKFINPFPAGSYVSLTANDDRPIDGVKVLQVISCTQTSVTLATPSGWDFSLGYSFIGNASVSVISQAAWRPTGKPVYPRDYLYYSSIGNFFAQTVDGANIIKGDMVQLYSATLSKSLNKLVGADVRVGNGNLSKQSLLIKADTVKLRADQFKVSGVVRGEPANFVTGSITKFKIPAFKMQLFYSPLSNKLTTQDKLKADSAKVLVSKVISSAKLTAPSKYYNIEQLNPMKFYSNHMFESPTSSTIEKAISKLIEIVNDKDYGAVDARKVFTFVEPSYDLLSTNTLKASFVLTAYAKPDITSGLINKFRLPANITEVFYTPAISKLSVASVIRGEPSKVNAGTMKAMQVLRGELARIESGTVQKDSFKLRNASNESPVVSLINPVKFLNNEVFSLGTTGQVNNPVAKLTNDLAKVLSGNVSKQSIIIKADNTKVKAETLRSMTVLKTDATYSRVNYISKFRVPSNNTIVFYTPAFNKLSSAASLRGQFVPLTVSKLTAVSKLRANYIEAPANAMLEKFRMPSGRVQTFETPGLAKLTAITRLIDNTIASNYGKIVSPITLRPDVSPRDVLDFTNYQDQTYVSSGGTPKTASELFYFFNVAPGLRANLTANQGVAFTQDVPFVNEASHLGVFDNIGITDTKLQVINKVDPGALRITNRSAEFTNNTILWYQEDLDTITTVPLNQPLVTLYFAPQLAIPYLTGSTVILSPVETPAAFEAKRYTVLAATTNSITVAVDGEFPSISNLYIYQDSNYQITLLFSQQSIRPYAVGSYVVIEDTSVGKTMTVQVLDAGYSHITFARPTNYFPINVSATIISNASISVVPRIYVRTTTEPINARERLFYAEAAPGYRSNSSVNQGWLFTGESSSIANVEMLSRDSLKVVEAFDKLHNTVERFLSKIELKQKLTPILSESTLARQSYIRFLKLPANRTEVFNTPKMGQGWQGLVVDGTVDSHVMYDITGEFKQLFKFAGFDTDRLLTLTSSQKAYKIPAMQWQLFYVPSYSLVAKLRTGDFKLGSTGIVDVAVRKKDPIQFWN